MRPIRVSSTVQMAYNSLINGIFSTNLKIVQYHITIGKDVIMELDPGPILDLSVEKVQTWLMIARKTIKSRAYEI